MEFSNEIKILMATYTENVNLVGKINAELCHKYGLESELAEFSSNLMTALNQYKRFIDIIEDTEGFLKLIVKFSESCISFFNIADTDNKTKIFFKKTNELMEDMNKISEFINNNFFKDIKKYYD